MQSGYNLGNYPSTLHSQLGKIETYTNRMDTLHTQTLQKTDI